MDTATQLFDTYIRASIMKEGGEKYTNDPYDRGGATKWGITQQRARAAGYQGDMRDLDFDTAYAIYRLFFWTQPMFDKICDIDSHLAKLLLDLGINRGTGVPVKWLQRALNVMNQGATAYHDIIVDGVAGAMTRQALKDYLAMRHDQGERVLYRAIESFAAVDYMEIAEKTSTQERFEYGWLLHRAFQAEL